MTREKNESDELHDLVYPMPFIIRTYNRHAMDDKSATAQITAFMQASPHPGLFRSQVIVAKSGDRVRCDRTTGET